MLKRKLDSRFLELNDNQLEEKRESLQKENTVKCDKKVHKLFVEYLTARCAEKVENNFEYWTYLDQLLDEILCKFWFETRQVTGEMYTINSLKNIRYGINRNLKRHGKEKDITKSDCFTKNQQAFADACKELKALGFGFVKHYDEIKTKGWFS